jgi:hypothetical protein
MFRIIRTAIRAGIPARVLAHLRGNVVAYLALFFALGGGVATAAGTIGAREMESIYARQASRDVAAHSMRRLNVSCYRDDDDLLSFNAYWRKFEAIATPITSAVGHPPNRVKAVGLNDTDETQEMVVEILCLPH